jgi:hypothetical protein
MLRTYTIHTTLEHNAVCCKLRRVTLVRTDVSEDRISSIIKVTTIGEAGTKLAVTSNRSTLRRRNVFPVGYELGFVIPEDSIFHSRLRGNRKSYVTSRPDVRNLRTFLPHRKGPYFTALSVTRPLPKTQTRVLWSIVHAKTRQRPRECWMQLFRAYISKTGYISVSRWCDGSLRKS